MVTPDKVPAETPAKPVATLSSVLPEAATVLQVT